MKSRYSFSNKCACCDSLAFCRPRTRIYFSATSDYKISTMFENSDISLILRAFRFAAQKHRKQRRKDGETPYINHLIDVAEVLWRDGNVRDPEIIVAGILHDTLEDTQSTPEEIRSHFGEKILAWVQEVSDDKSLAKEERKQLQIMRASSSSDGAKHIKIADKICNIRDLLRNPPADWPLERIQQYIRWSNQVMAGLRGCNAQLESVYDETMEAVSKEYGL